MSKTAEAPDFFTVYYMNQQKVYEMRMLLNNILWKDGTSEEEKATSGEAEVHANGEGNIPFISKINGEVNGDLGHEKRTKMIDTLEYINTKSRMLSEIKANCFRFDKSSSKEGDLVYIEDVSLTLLNENEVRTLIDRKSVV